MVDKRKQRKIQADINIKKFRDRINVPMDLTALPTGDAFKNIPELSRIGFYMQVWISMKELDVYPVMSEELLERRTALFDWLQSVEEHLPTWFATRYLK